MASEIEEIRVFHQQRAIQRALVGTKRQSGVFMGIGTQGVEPAVVDNVEPGVSHSNQRVPHIDTNLVIGAVVLNQRLDVALGRKRISELEYGKIGGKIPH